MKPSLCTINIPTINLENSMKFYNYLCEYEFAQSVAEVDARFVPISIDGIFLTLTQPFREGEPVVCYFGVRDLDKAIAELKERGGELMAGPFDMPVPPEMVDELRRESKRLKGGEEFTPTLGKAAILKDPDGNGVGLLCLERHAHEYFRVGDHHTHVTTEQLAKHTSAIARGKRFSRLRKGGKGG